MCNEEILDGIEPFNGVCIIIKGMCLLNITPMPININGQYQIKLGIPDLASHTAKIKYCQYDLKTLQWLEPSNTVPLSELNKIYEEGASYVRIKNSALPYPTPSARFLSFSYATNISQLYQLRDLANPDEDIIVNWDRLKYQIEFFSDNGNFCTFKLSINNNKELIWSDFSRENTSYVFPFGYIADSICYKLHFDSGQELVFQGNDSKWITRREDHKFTIVEINNKATDHKDCEIYNCYYKEQIITMKKDGANIEVGKKNRILPTTEIASKHGPVDGPAYCSPLVTTYPPR